MATKKKVEMEKAQVIAVLQDTENPLDVSAVELFVTTQAVALESASQALASLQAEWNALVAAVALTEGESLLARLKHVMSTHSDLTAQLLERDTVIVTFREALVNKIAGRMEILKPGNQDAVARFKTRAATMTLEQLNHELDDVDAEIREHYHIPRLTVASELQHSQEFRDFSAYRVR